MPYQQGRSQGICLSRGQDIDQAAASSAVSWRGLTDRGRSNKLVDPSESFRESPTNEAMLDADAQPLSELR